MADQRRTDYEGHLFERVCQQWVVRQARAGALPLMVTKVDSWWGTDPTVRERADVDVVASDELGSKDVLVGECKWRESFDESEAVDTLRHRVALVGSYSNRWYYVFSKHPASRASLAKAKDVGNLQLVCADELFG